MSDGYRLANEAAVALFDDPLPESGSVLFTATVTTVAFPFAKIRPTRATTAGEQLIGMINGRVPAVSDRVLCCWVGGEPVILGPIAKLGDPVLGVDFKGPRIVAAPGVSLNTAANSPFSSGNCYALYMGRADDAWEYVAVRFEVTVAAATIAWAEIGIATSAEFELGSNVTLTERGYVDVSAAVNSLGEKTVYLAPSGIARGDHVWLLAGSSATTPFQVYAGTGGLLSGGQFQSSGTTRPSTMPSNETFTIQSNTAGWFALITGI